MCSFGNGKGGRYRRDGQLQCVVQVDCGSLDQVLKSSGQHGVVTRDYYTLETSRDRFKVAPLPLDVVSLDGALRSAASLGDQAWGVVPLKRGYGVRALAAAWEAVVTEVQGENARNSLTIL